MRISDWSSDVCSSDLTRRGNLAAPFPATEQFRQAVALFLDQCRDALAHGGDGLALLQRGLALLDLGPQCIEFADGKCGNIGRPRVTPAKYQCVDHLGRSAEHTSELQSLMRISYAVFCLKTKNYT